MKQLYEDTFGEAYVRAAGRQCRYRPLGRGGGLVCPLGRGRRQFAHSGVVGAGAVIGAAQQSGFYQQRPRGGIKKPRLAQKVAYSGV
jgi:hypothetical protein